MSGGWGCPHDVDGKCIIREVLCEPGEPGCVLEERMANKAPLGKVDAGSNNNEDLEAED